jgi:hypothetical protein
MSICVQYDSNSGSLISSSVPISECNDYILLSLDEYNTYSSFNSFDKDMYDAGFGGVITLFVAGIAVGSIIAIIKKIGR